MGETAIDEETFNEYLEEMRQHYTADKVGSCVCHVQGGPLADTHAVSLIRYLHD